MRQGITTAGRPLVCSVAPNPRLMEHVVTTCSGETSKCHKVTNFKIVYIHYNFHWEIPIGQIVIGLIVKLLFID